MEKLNSSPHKTNLAAKDEMVQVLSSADNSSVALPVNSVSGEFVSSPVPPLLSPLTTSAIMSADNQQDCKPVPLPSPSDAGSLVSNSQLDANVQSFVPQTNYQPHGAMYHQAAMPLLYVNTVEHGEVPHNYATPGAGGEGVISETNTSVPPPVLAYDHNGQIVHPYPVYYPPQHYIQMTQAQQAMYQYPSQYTYAVSPQEFYTEGGVREDVAEENSVERRRLSSTSSGVGPVSNAIDYPQHPNKSRSSPYGTSPSMVHLEHCHVNFLCQNIPSNALASGSNGAPYHMNAPLQQHAATPAMLTAPPHTLPHMVPNTYSSPIMDQQQHIVNSANYVRARQPLASVQGFVANHSPNNANKPIYCVDNQDRGAVNFRGGLGSRGGRGGVIPNRNPTTRRSVSRRSEGDRNSTSSDMNSFSNDRGQYPNERNPASDHPDILNHMTNSHEGQHIEEHVSHTAPQYVYYPTTAFSHGAKKLEGQPLVMSHPNNFIPHNEHIVYMAPPTTMTEIPYSQYYQPRYVPHKDLQQYVDHTKLVENAGNMNQCVGLPGNVVPVPVVTTQVSESFIYNCETGVNLASNNVENEVYHHSRPLSVDSGLSVASIEEAIPVQSADGISQPQVNNGSRQSTPIPTPMVGPVTTEQLANTLDSMNFENGKPVNDTTTRHECGQHVPSKKVTPMNESSSKVIPIMDIKTENQLDLSFTMKFGDICPEEVYNVVNKSCDTSNRQKIKDVKSKADNFMSSCKSNLTPLFDTTTQVDNAVCSRISSNKSPGCSLFVLEDCHSEEMSYSEANGHVHRTSVKMPAAPTATVTSVVAVTSSTVSHTTTPAHGNGMISTSVTNVSTKAVTVVTATGYTGGRVPTPAVTNGHAIPVIQHSVQASNFVMAQGAAAVITATPAPVNAPTASIIATASASIAPLPSTKTMAVAPAVHAPTVEKPPLPVAAKKAPAESSSGCISAWGRQKNWTEEFKPNSSDQQKKIAVVQPLQMSGAVTQSADRSVTPSVSISFAATVCAPPPGSTGKQEKPAPTDVSSFEIERTKIGTFLLNYTPDYSSVMLQPRGLTNKNYWCYSNTVLQAMICVPQLVNLYKKMNEELGSLITSETLPVAHSIISFLKEFVPMCSSHTNLNTNSRARGKKPSHSVTLPEVVLGDPFEPSCINKMLLEKNGSQFMEGCQQDAEEMLTFLLNAGHDEFNECLKLATGGTAAATTTPELPNGNPDDYDEEDWLTKGPKNKACVTRTTEISQSPISKIFWGISRSIIKKGSSQSANLEPFITLPLDIQDEKITSVKIALEQFVSRTDVAGYTCTDTQEELTVINQRLIEQLPEVLILQLKRFVYSVDGGLQKIVKDISISPDLEITNNLLSTYGRKKVAGDKSKYKLTSIIYHDGKEASKGHYVSDVYHAGYNCWLNYDDACVKAIPAVELQRCNAPRVPYLLFYRREDTFVDGTNPTFAVGAPNKKRKPHEIRTASLEKIEAYGRPAADIKQSENTDEKNKTKSDNNKSTADRKTSTERKQTNNNTNNNTQKNKRQDKKSFGKKNAKKLTLGTTVE